MYKQELREETTLFQLCGQQGIFLRLLPQSTSSFGETLTTVLCGSGENPQHSNTQVFTLYVIIGI